MNRLESQTDNELRQALLRHGYLLRWTQNEDCDVEIASVRVSG
jgi:hypothetical protein